MLKHKLQTQVGATFSANRWNAEREGVRLVEQKHKSPFLLVKYKIIAENIMANRLRDDQFIDFNINYNLIFTKFDDD